MIRKVCVLYMQQSVCHMCVHLTLFNCLFCIRFLMNDMKKKDINHKINFIDSIMKENKNGGLLALLPDSSLQYFSCADSRIFTRCKDLKWDDLSGYVFFENNDTIIQYGCHLSNVNYKICELKKPSQTNKGEVSATSQTDKEEDRRKSKYTISAKQIQAL